MQDRKTRRLVGAITAGFVAALAAVPLAQARLAVDVARGTLSQNASVVRTDARHAALANKLPVVVEIVQAPQESRISEMHRQLGHLKLPGQQAPITDESTGIDWTDAGIGAGSVFGLMLLAGGALRVTRRRLVSA
jgi:hypothetical protein